MAYLNALHVQVCDDPGHLKSPPQATAFIRSQSPVLDRRQLHVRVLASHEKPTGPMSLTGGAVVPPSGMRWIPRSWTSPDDGGGCSAGEGLSAALLSVTTDNTSAAVKRPKHSDLIWFTFLMDTPFVICPTTERCYLPFPSDSTACGAMTHPRCRAA